MNQPSAVIIAAALVGALFVVTPARAAPSVCVLVFEQATSRIAIETSKVFQSAENTQVILQAIPTDLRDCILGNYEEIILIAHAIEDPSHSKSVSLGYFKPLTPGQIQLGIQNGDFIPGSKPPGWDEGQPIYQVEEFLPQIFRTIYAELLARQKNAIPLSLKRIRWMSCLPERVFEAYPEFQKIVDEFNIGVDVAPAQVMMSTLLGEKVTGFDRLWLAESTQTDAAPSGDSWFYSYIDLSTLLIWEFGNSTALHGHYKIHYQGFALGLAARWTELFIRYKDIEGMQVGEKRTISAPHLDISIGIGEDFEVDLLPLPQLEIPSDLDSLGFSMSLWESIEIERVY